MSDLHTAHDAVPPDEAYEAAALADVESAPDRPDDPAEFARRVSSSLVCPQVRSTVDAVWPLAVARLEAERDKVRARLETAWASLDEHGWQVMSLHARLARMRPVYDAVRLVVEHQQPGQHAGPAWESRRDELWGSLVAVLAAVDQTAPSSPLETPHTADGGEAGVVEGAGGSEAVEGRPPRRPERRTPLSRERAAALVGSNTRVRVWLNHNGGVADEGVVIGYLERPSVIIQRPDGSQSSWSIDLDYEELGTDG